MSNWKSEFPSAYDVPARITENPHLRDVSWGNDACPSFMLKRIPVDADNVARLWCEHPDESLREIRGKRYVVAEYANDYSECVDLIETDDVAEALRVILAWKPKSERTFITPEAEKLSDPDLERRHGPNDRVETYRSDSGETVVCLTGEREDFEMESGVSIESDTLANEIFKSLCDSLRANHGLESI